ncbi:phosphate ABC transporter permease PstA [Rufibacter roseus]|uniref:Phosphate transport system permease protein PstA n=1 Tax=Rufibacter roseus TaxID=1567108 RepID=A0ABW2DHU0_9BACT|nr:phosphate ABC transporter permease PstA [Rufibacter roseus]
MTNSTRNRIKDKAFQFFGIFCMLIGLVFLGALLVDIITRGLGRIDWDFLTSLPSRRASRSGILTAWAGTLWILLLTSLIAFPLGISAGVYLEEYTKKSKLSSFLEINIANLAGVPSIIYGLLGLEVFVRQMQMGASLLAGALTLSLLVLPIVIVTTREALKAVPPSVRQGSFALGATKWQTTWRQVLPASFGGILTGVILALSRAVGEAAPLIVVGALAYVPFVPSSPNDEFTVLPIQIFNWTSRPQAEFLVNAAAAIIMLLFITFLLNGVAVYLRNKQQKKIKW